MSVKSFLFAGAAAVTLLAGAAPASAEPYYSCNGGRCYDDQAEETRELNLRQLDHPGAGVRAVPGYHGPRDDYDDDRYGDDRDDDRSGDDRDDEDHAHMDHGHHMHGGDSGGYRSRGDDDHGYGRPDNDDDQYGDDDQNDDSADDNDDRDDDHR